MKKSLNSVATLVVSISMVAMLLSSSVAHAQTSPKFIYDMKENVETVFTLDESGRYLTPKLRYEYQKNEEGNVLSKTASRWNAVKNQWTPYYLISFNNSQNVITAEYAQWNEKDNSFSQNIQKAVYNHEAGNELVTYQAYNWNPDMQIWDLSQQLISQNYLADTDVIK